MNKQQAINQQILDADTVRGNGHKPVNSLAAKVNEIRLVLNGQLTQAEIEQLDLDLTSKSPSKQRQILLAWFDYEEERNIFAAAKVRVTALARWDGKTIWIYRNKGGQNVFLWKDRNANIILEWQKLDSRGLRERGEIVRVGYLIPGAIVDPWRFSLTEEEYDSWVARINGQAPALPKRDLQGGFLASESTGNYGKRRYQ